MPLFPWAVGCSPHVHPRVIGSPEVQRHSQPVFHYLTLCLFKPALEIRSARLQHIWEWLSSKGCVLLVSVHISALITLRQWQSAPHSIRLWDGHYFSRLAHEQIAEAVADEKLQEWPCASTEHFAQPTNANASSWQLREILTTKVKLTVSPKNALIISVKNRLDR